MYNCNITIEIKDTSMESREDKEITRLKERIEAVEYFKKHKVVELMDGNHWRKVVNPRWYSAGIS